MHQLTGRIVTAFLALAKPCVVQAQICVGRPGPESGRIQLGLGHWSAERQSSFSNSFGGVTSSMFGQLSNSTVRFDGSGDELSLLGADLGIRLAVGESGRTELCPTVGGSVGEAHTLIVTGPGMASRVRLASTRSASVGVAVGSRIRVTEGLAVTPALRARYVHFAFDFDALDVESSTNYGEFTFSTGLVVGTRLTISPAISRRVGVDRANTSWGIAVTLSLWSNTPSGDTE